jgi:hypothetical protein
MEVNIEMRHNNTLKIRNSKPNSHGGHHKAKVMIFNRINMKPEGVPPEQAWRARLTDEGVRRKV